MPQTLKNIETSGEIVLYQPDDSLSLDAILSVGYRVSSCNATLFRRWATAVLKDYLLKGYNINQRLVYMEERIDRRLNSIESTLAEHQQKIDFFIADIQSRIWAKNLQP